MKPIVLVAVSFALLLSLSPASAQPQRRDRAVFGTRRDAFREQLLERASEKETEPAKPEIALDLAGVVAPASPDEFDQVWHFPPICQELTGACWAFSSTSFFESEIHRLSGQSVRLSEAFTIYHEWLDKALRFVERRGDSYFSIGSEPNAAVRVWRDHGIVPADTYPGNRTDAGLFDDRKLFPELKEYLESLRDSGNWDVAAAGAETAVRAILDRHMGPRPATVTLDGRELTPREYLRDVLALNLDDYVNLLSLVEKPYRTFVEYEVPDNWWHSREYYNVPLDEFVAVIRTALRSGYSVCVAGDTSEAGYDFPAGIGMIPTFDIPADYIDENARQLRFTHESTTDDHAYHLVGWLERNGDEWFLAKDSSTKAQNAPHPGYIFLHADFVKLKVMNLLVHRDAVRRVIPEFGG